MAEPDIDLVRQAIAAFKREIRKRRASARLIVSDDGTVQIELFHSRGLVRFKFEDGVTRLSTERVIRYGRAKTLKRAISNAFRGKPYYDYDPYGWAYGEPS